MNVCLVGGGNIGQAIIEGLLKSGMSVDSIACVERNPVKIEILQILKIQMLSLKELSHNQFDLIVLAVKPKDALETAKDILETVPNANIVSVVAGIEINKYALPSNVIRAMPNTASAFGKGITALYADNKNSPAFKNALSLFEKVGHVLIMESESKIHSFTSIIGSGQAFLFRVLGIYLEELKQLSNTNEEHTIELFQNFVSSLGDLFNEDLDFDSLINKIKSPGGTTQAGLESLEKNNVELIFKEAFNAAKDRSIEISNEH